MKPKEVASTDKEVNDEISSDEESEEGERSGPTYNHYGMFFSHDNSYMYCIRLDNEDNGRFRLERLKIWDDKADWEKIQINQEKLEKKIYICNRIFTVIPTHSVHPWLQDKFGSNSALCVLN